MTIYAPTRVYSEVVGRMDKTKSRNVMTQSILGFNKNSIPGDQHGVRIGKVAVSSFVSESAGMTKHRARDDSHTP